MLRRLFMWAMIASLSVCALAGIVVLLFPRIPFEEEVLGSAATVGLYSLLAMVCAIVIERARSTAHRLLGSAGIALALLAMALLLIEIWAQRWFIPEEAVFKSVTTATLLAANAAHFGLYSRVRLLGAARWITLGTLLSATAFCVLMAILVWIEPNEDMVFRLMGILGILAVTGSALTPIVWKMQAPRREDEARPTMRGNLRLSLRCPRCNLEQDLPLGHAKCRQCKLQIRIEVEEPRCACGYQLLGLKADHCPECGRQIPEDDRWAIIQEP